MILTMRAAGQEIRQERPLQTGCDRAGFGFALCGCSFPFLLVLHVVVCLLLVLGCSDAASSQRGSRGGLRRRCYGEHLRRPDDPCLGKFTVWLGVAFFAITLAWLSPYSHQGRRSQCVQRNCSIPRRRRLTAAAVPAATASRARHQSSPAAGASPTEHRLRPLQAVRSAERSGRPGA